MSFTNLRYDPTAYKHSLQESVGPGQYMVGTPLAGCKPCFQQSPFTRSTTATCSTQWKDLVDVNSDLMGITRKATLDPSGQHSPGQGQVAGCKAVVPDSQRCDGLTPESTRLSNPPCTMRGTGWNRWQWLCEDPQQHAFRPFTHSISSRTLAKDNHRPLVPSPSSQPKSLPPALAPAPGPATAASQHHQTATPKVGADSLYSSQHWHDCQAVDALLRGT